MGVHVPLDYVLVTWHDGRVQMETTAPVTDAKRLSLSLLFATAARQVRNDKKVAR